MIRNLFKEQWLEHMPCDQIGFEFYRCEAFSLILFQLSLSRGSIQELHLYECCEGYRRWVPVGFAYKAQLP